MRWSRFVAFAGLLACLSVALVMSDVPIVHAASATLAFQADGGSTPLWVVVLMGAAKIVFPTIALFLTAQAMKIWDKIKALPSFEMRVLIAVLGVAFTQIGSIFHVDLSGWATGGFSTDSWIGLLDAALAMLLFRFTHPKPA